MSFSGQTYLYKINGLVNAFVAIVNDYIFEGIQNNISKINSSINKVIRWKKPLKAFQAATSCAAITDRINSPWRLECFSSFQWAAKLGLVLVQVSSLKSFLTHLSDAWHHLAGKINIVSHIVISRAKFVGFRFVRWQLKALCRSNLGFMSRLLALAHKQDI